MGVHFPAGECCARLFCCLLFVTMVFDAARLAPAAAACLFATRPPGLVVCPATMEVETLEVFVKPCCHHLSPPPTHQSTADPGPAVDAPYCCPKPFSPERCVAECKITTHQYNNTIN